MENQPASKENLKVAPKSVAAMILGICSVGSFFIYGIPGIVCGILALVFSAQARRAYNQNPSIYTEGSDKMIKTGFVTGLIGLILSVLFLIGVVVLIAFALSCGL
jgi:uncharacterized membrane protein